MLPHHLGYGQGCEDMPNMDLTKQHLDLQTLQHGGLAASSRQACWNQQLQHRQHRQNGFRLHQAAKKSVQGTFARSKKPKLSSISSCRLSYPRPKGHSATREISSCSGLLALARSSTARAWDEGTLLEAWKRKT